jgi:hypothetical protein
MIQPVYPNAHVMLRLSQQAPATPDRETTVEIWLKGTRFRVRDRSDRRIDEILGDVTAPPGLGLPARTREDLMDLESEARAPDNRSDRALRGSRNRSGLGVSAGEPRWPIPTKDLVPAAEQILARGKTDGLQARGIATRLGRACTRYEVSST